VKTIEGIFKHRAHQSDFRKHRGKACAKDEVMFRKNVTSSTRVSSKIHGLHTRITGLYATAIGQSEGDRNAWSPHRSVFNHRRFLSFLPIRICWTRYSSYRYAAQLSCHIRARRKFTSQR
jgi:hypothetical protein